MAAHSSAACARVAVDRWWHGCGARPRHGSTSSRDARRTRGAFDRMGGEDTMPGTTERLRRFTSASGAKGVALAGALAGAMVMFAAGVAGAAPLGATADFTLPAASSPRSIVAGPDGNLWFNDMGTPKAIGRITPDGAVTEFTAGLIPASAPADIVAGPDGNVWFADRGTTGAIGRITPGGAITEFTSGLPAGSSPRGMAEGPDGNLWFGEDGTTKAIGRIDPATGAITEFSTGLNAGSSPTGLAPGPDGNIWFADKGTPKAIGRITPGGGITEFALPATSAPADIDAGPDGNLWFTDQGTPKAIGRITPGGAITEFTSGLGASNLPNGLAAGADGNIWFADRGTGATPVKAIGRITPGGTITEFALPAASSPRGVAAGPDGNLWFGDAGTPRAIGQFGVGAPAASVTPPAVVGSHGVGVPQTCVGDTWSSWAGQQPSHDAHGFDGYRWLLDGTPIPGATGPSYTPTGADAGHQLSCEATVTYTLFPVTVSATSAAVPVEGAAEQVGDLLARVTGVGPGKSLAAKVSAIQDAVAAGDTAEA